MKTAFRLTQGQNVRVPPLNLDEIPDRYDGPLILDPAGAIERFHYYESLGVTDVNLTMQVGAPLDELIHAMEVISTQVMPEFG